MKIAVAGDEFGLDPIYAGQRGGVSIEGVIQPGSSLRH